VQTSFSSGSGNGSERCIRGTQLGGGGFGRVFKVRRESDGALLAGKHTSQRRKMTDEAAALQAHRHAHIVRFEGMYEVPDRPNETMLLTELCDKGNLQSQIDSHQFGMKPVAILRAVRQLASALHHLHSRGFFHTDFKPANVFIRSLEPMDVVLGDMADVQPVGKENLQTMGTQWLWSPEIWKQRVAVGPSDDIWALGISLMAMCGQLPRFEYRPTKNKRTSKARFDLFPKQCLEHLAKLRELNPGHGMVELMGKMVTRTSEERSRAYQVMLMAETILEQWERRAGDDAAVGGGGGGGEALGIKSPEGFVPPSFW
jgi:serine/threonine protein kinase